MTTTRKDGRRPPAGAVRRAASAKPQRPRGKPAPAKAAADGERIAKIMARAGLCSRRDAEAWIAAGRVALNGAVLTSPAANVRPGDAVLVDGQPLAQRERTRLFLFNKPRGLVTTDRDPEGRQTVFDHLRTHWPDGPRVVTIGRLDINTEGLLLLTNDGGLARVLELPATGWLRRYRVRANGAVDQAALDRLKDGVTLDGVDYAGVEAVLDRVQGANVWLTVGLREGKNREVKRLLEHVGLAVNRLIRISFGPFQLGTLGDGKVEEVRTRVLRDQLGTTLAAQANADFTSPLAAPAAPVPAEPSRRERPPPKGLPRASRPAKPRFDDKPRFERERAAPPRGRERPLPPGGRPGKPRVEDSGRAPPPPLLDRPKAGPRKHVSALRADAAAAQGGDRRRVERGATADRKGRAVAVERLVPARPAGADKPHRTGRPSRPERDARPDRPGGQAPRKAGRFERDRAPRGGGPNEARRDDKHGRGGPPPKTAGGRKPGPRRDGERPRPRPQR